MQTAFEVCVESASGIIASADVAYLLSFSIIMLNTGTPPYVSASVCRRPRRLA
jgi:hypothetical protein